MKVMYNDLHLLPFVKSNKTPPQFFQDGIFCFSVFTL